jgi:hypothetical protein
MNRNLVYLPARKQSLSVSMSGGSILKAEVLKSSLQHVAIVSVTRLFIVVYIIIIN